MPGKVKVKIISGRNLPVMDRSSDTTDAYVEIKLGPTTYKTDVCRKSLHPQWNSEWYRFEVDDAELQDEPLQIRLMDHDTYSANDAIGKVYLDLNPLLLPATSLLRKWNDSGNSSHEGNNSVMSGWIPVYDTMHGIRGEVNVIVKVELFSDFNKFRQSSCGVQFFYSPAIPHGFYAQVLHGFVEELVVNDDPEYQWIDKIRTPRASNEARQTLFRKLSGELQRKIGLKALEMGGNAVIGYNQSFDLEGESGIVARGIGTAVTLIKIADEPNHENITNEERAQKYLNFLGSAKGFYLNNDFNNYSTPLKPALFTIPSPTASIRSLKSEQKFKPERMPKLLTRHLSDREFDYPPILLEDQMLHHSVSLQTLLKQEDMRGRPGYGISQKFKNLKFSSQNIISRKMIALKQKLGNDDNDTETPGSLKRPSMKYRRTQSDNGGMAEILVRSVFHAASSLDCIAESPKIIPEEDDVHDRSFLSLPTPLQGDTASSNASCTESSSSADEDEDDDEEEDEIAGQDTIAELDTVSHIVETVRKLSMIQSPVVEDLEYEDNKFLFVIGDETNAPGTFEDTEDGNLLYYAETDVGVSESFLPQIEAVFRSMRKSTTAKSLSDINLQGNILNKKFTSLHNIHRATSRVNKYSEHGGKETVLGELFRRIDNTPHEEMEYEESPFEEMQIALGKGLKDSIHDMLSQEESHVEVYNDSNTTQFQKTSGLKKTKHILGLSSLENLDNSKEEAKEVHQEHDHKEEVQKDIRTHKGFLSRKVLNALHKLDAKWHHKETKHVAVAALEQQNENETKTTKKALGQDNESNNSLTSEERGHGFLHKLKEGKDKLIHKMHHENKGGIKNEHGLLNIALGNVLMDSVQEVLATSHSESPEAKPFVFPPHSHVLDLEETSLKDDTIEKEISATDNQKTIEVLSRIDQGDEEKIDHDESITLRTNENSNNKNKSLESLENNANSANVTKEPKASFMQKLKAKKIKLFQESKDLFHRFGSKNTSNIKNDHGLLNMALGNVLMDSVQEVLATSHSESPQSNPFDFPNSSQTLKDSQNAKNFSDSLEKINSDNSRSSNEKPSNKFSIEKTPSNQFSNEKTPSNQPKNNESHIEQLFTDKSPSQIQVDQMVNTELDGSDRDSNNSTHACLTPPRSIETTPPSADSKTTEPTHQRAESLGVRISHSPAKLNAIPCIHRRSSDSDLSITPKGNSLTGSDRSGGYSSGQYMRGAMIRTTRPQENFDIMEYPFLTLSKYPPGFIAHIGGSVSARSVKLLERISNLEQPESRDTWWSEIRMEIRSHARALNCNAVLGYTESTSICDDVCVLSASGTAAVLGFQYSGEAADNIGGLPVLPKSSNNSQMTTSLDRNDFEKEKSSKEQPPIPTSNVKTEKPCEKPKIVPTSSGSNASNTSNSPERDRDSSVSGSSVKSSCSICHLPYFTNSKPLRMSSIKCLICGAYKVPDMLIATIEMPDGMSNFGRGCFIQSYVCRPVKDLKGESYAKEISDGLPFLEYELHRFLINKLKIKGMNAIFGLKVRISIGERMLIGIATGTAIFISALPPPLLPKLVSDRTTDEKKLSQLQKKLHETIKKNREIYQLRSIDEVTNGPTTKQLLLDADDSEEEIAALDLSAGNKDCCILEVDDPDDVDVLNSLMEPRPPDGFHVVNTEHVPGLEDLEIVKNLQMFTQIWRAKIPPPFNLDKHFHRLLQSVYFKLRRMIPCALCDLQFRVDSPEPDEIQLCVLGMALGLGDPFKNPKKRKVPLQKRNVGDEDLIFNLEEDQIPEHSIAQTPPTTHLLHAQTLKHRQKSPIRNKLLKQRHVPYRERHGVDITPLSYVPGGKIEKYLGNLNFFLIRETTSLREEGGLSGFVHSFVTEILAIVRAHVTALGGNAMVAYFITECLLNHNLHKNQGQCLINVGGDVVYVSYFPEDH